MLLILAAWVASIFVVVILIRPLMDINESYGLLIIAYLFASLAPLFYGLIRVHRWFGLRCPCCGATFIHFDPDNSKKDPVQAAEDDHRCGKCHAVIIDLDA